MRRILIVEDEKDAEQTLVSHLGRYGRETGEEFRLSWAKSAKEATSLEEAYDLIFLDIELPGMNGMDMAHLLRSYDTKTPIIFVTNLAQYALRGYEVDALDFMVKPVSYGAFRMRMNKAMRVLSRSREHTVCLSQGRDFLVVEARDIMAVEVRNHNLTYHVSGEKDPVTVRGSMAQAEGELEGESFVRASNCYLVNLDYVTGVSGNDLIVDGRLALKMSRGRKPEVLASMARHFGGDQ